MDVHTKFGDSKLNNDLVIIRRTRFMHFCAVFNCICSRLETASDAIYGTFVGLVAHDKGVKFREPSLNIYLEFPPEAVVGDIFYSLFELR